MADLVTVGRVGKPHGLDGAFVVERASEEPQRFAVGATFDVDGEPATVIESKRAGGRPVIRVDRDLPRGAELRIDRGALPEPGEGAYYVFQLVGLEVRERDGDTLGRVREVSPGPANDVLELDTGLLLPLVDACVQEVDLDAGTILVERGFAGAD